MAYLNRPIHVRPVVPTRRLTGTGADAAKGTGKDVVFLVDLEGPVRVAFRDRLDVGRDIRLGGAGRLAGDILVQGFKIQLGIEKTGELRELGGAGRLLVLDIQPFNRFFERVHASHPIR